MLLYNVYKRSVKQKETLCKKKADSEAAVHARFYLQRAKIDHRMCINRNDWQAVCVDVIIHTAILTANLTMSLGVCIH